MERVAKKKDNPGSGTGRDARTRAQKMNGHTYSQDPDAKVATSPELFLDNQQRCLQ